MNLTFSSFSYLFHIKKRILNMKIENVKKENKVKISTINGRTNCLLGQLSVGNSIVDRGRQTFFGKGLMVKIEMAGQLTNWKIFI